MDRAAAGSAGQLGQTALIAVVARVSRLLLGDSLFALRFFPAVAAAALVLLTGLMARALGGGWNAQVIAAVAVCVVPVYALFGNVLTMNSFEPLLWMGAAYLAIRIAKGGSPRHIKTTWGARRSRC